LDGGLPDHKLPLSPYEFTGKNDFGFEMLLRKILEIEGNQEIRLA
jgi:hypothetical protein